MDDLIDQHKSLNFLKDTTPTDAPLPQPTKEYIETPVDPPAGNSTTATNTFSESRVEHCKQEMDDLAVQREEYFPFSNCLVFESSQLDPYLHPEKSSPQADHHLELFPGNYSTTHSHQQPEIASFLLSPSHGQFVSVCSSSAFRTDS